MDYEKQAIEIMRTFCSDGCTVADSGGKDSSVLTHIAEKSGVPFKVVHNLTTVDAPETVYFVRNKFRELKKRGIDAQIIYPKHSMWELIMMHHTPPTRIIRYCCAELKENYGDGEKIVTGVRKAESISRKKNQGMVTIIKPSKALLSSIEEKSYVAQNSKGGLILNMDNDESRRLVENCYRTHKTLINPLIEWDDEYLKWYIEKEKIVLNPQYGKGACRVGCVGCPMSGTAQKLKEFEQYPKLKEAYIRTFDRMLKDRKEKGMHSKLDDFENGRELFKWWIFEKYEPEQIEIADWLEDIGAISKKEKKKYEKYIF